MRLRDWRAKNHALVGLLGLAAIVLGACAGNSSNGQASKVVFLSSQGSEVAEAQGMRTKVLNGFGPGADFIPVEDDTAVFNRLSAEQKSGHGTVDLVGALHGGMVSFQAAGQLMDLSDLASQLQADGIPKSLMDLGKLGTGKQYYIPWIQATYIMVANKKAEQYLPPGASLKTLTYDQLLQWARNIDTSTGQPKLGFPAGPNGLLHRYFEGYLVPAFSGGVVTTFKSSGAISGWNYYRGLWKYVHPQSLTYDFMQDPLRSGEVWIAWDHVARLQAALDAQPNDFDVFPAPAGPDGRAFMPVIAGLAIPKTAPNAAAAKDLIKYLLGKSAQANTLGAIGFFPVVPGSTSNSLSAGLQLETTGVQAQASASDALESLLPVGLGSQGDAFNKVFRDTCGFRRDPATCSDSIRPPIPMNPATPRKEAAAAAA